MIQELLYTSYQGKGLRPGGGGGYCTVLSSSGMAANLATTLEMLSGYKHPFDVHDERAPKSPPNYRHAIIRLGGADVHVLSRIADAGGDHTGRSNKFAHHLALSPTDIAELQAAGVLGGPSALLSDPRVSRSDWDQKVQLVPALDPARVAAGDLPNRPCSAWERIAGDAGWAGMVADRLLAGDGQPTSIIYPLGTDALELLNEVLSLIPPQRRWNVTFSTYYTAALPNSSCHLRMLLDGTPEAAVLRRDYRQVIVDLAAPLAGPEDSPLVAAARSGEIRHPQVAAPGPRRARGTATAGPAGAAAATRGGAANMAPLEALPTLDAGDAELELEPLAAGGGRSAGAFRIFKSKARSGYAPSRPASPWRTALIAIAIVIAAMVVILASGAVALLAYRDVSRDKGPEVSDAPAAEESENAAAVVEPADSPKVTNFKAEVIKEEPVAKADEVQATVPSEEAEPKAPAAESPAPAPAPVPPASDPFPSTLGSQGPTGPERIQLKTPIPQVVLAKKKGESLAAKTNNAVSSQVAPLCEPLDGAIKNIQILGHTFDLESPNKFEQRVDASGTVTILLKTKSGTLGQLATYPIATVSAQGSALNFSWIGNEVSELITSQSDRAPEINSLRRCVVLFEVQGNKKYIPLDFPSEPIQVRLTRDHSRTLSNATEVPPAATRLRMEIPNFSQLENLKNAASKTKLIVTCAPSTAEEWAKQQAGANEFSLSTLMPTMASQNPGNAIPPDGRYSQKLFSVRFSLSQRSSNYPLSLVTHCTIILPPAHLSQPVWETRSVDSPRDADLAERVLSSTLNELQKEHSQLLQEFQKAEAAAKTGGDLAKSTAADAAAKVAAVESLILVAEAEQLLLNDLQSSSQTIDVNVKINFPENSDSLPLSTYYYGPRN